MHRLSNELELPSRRAFERENLWAQVFDMQERILRVVELDGLAGLLRDGDCIEFQTLALGSQRQFYGLHVVIVSQRDGLRMNEFAGFTHFQYNILSGIAVAL